MSHRSKNFFEIFPALQVQFAAHENLQMTWLWTDGSSMSYSPGWINNQPATQTSQNCVVMRDQVGPVWVLLKLQFDAKSLRVSMLASGNMLAVTRVSVTISTLSVKGRQSARVEIEQEHQ